MIAMLKFRRLVNANVSVSAKILCPEKNLYCSLKLN